MKYIIALLITLSFSSICSADALVWKVTKGKNTLYIGGTVHILRPTDYPLAPEYEKAYKQASSIVLETDLREMATSEAQQKLLFASMAKPGKTLKDVLTPKLYNELKVYITQKGMPFAQLEIMSPAMIMVTLMQLEMQAMGASMQTGVEAYFTQKATQDKKAIVGLENIDKAITLISSLGVGYENDFVSLSLQDMKKLSSEVDKLIKAWKQADVKYIENEMVARMKKEAPQMHREFLIDRNRAWMPQITKLANSAATEFVLVGSAHLVGKNSVLDLLRKQGYKIKRL